MNCCICNAEAKQVVASAFGPYSYAYCHKHLELGIEPYEDIVICLWSIGARSMSEINDDVHGLINRTLRHYSKTEEDLFSDVEKMQS